MGLFGGGRPIYGQLVRPTQDEIIVPNARAIRRKHDAQMVLTIQESAREQLHNLPIDDPTKLPEPVTELEGALSEHGWFVDDSPDARRSTREAAAIGWLIGRMENDSGAARSNESEQHYLNALMFLRTDALKPVTGPTVRTAWMACDAAYYLTRKPAENARDLVASWGARIE